MPVPIALALVLLVLSPQQPPPQKPPLPSTAPQLPPLPTATPPMSLQGPYEFTSDLGVFLIVVKADKTAKFDAAMTQLRQAFLQATKAARKQQASGWRVLKSTELATGAAPATPATPATATAPAVAAAPATAGTVTYLFLIDPVVKKTSYDPIEILMELLPGAVQSVYDLLKDSWVSATRIGLTELVRMGGGG